MDMTGPFNGLVKRALEMLKKTFGDTYPMGQVRRDHQLRTRFKIILHDARMKTDTPAMRLMRHDQPILLAELFCYIYQLEVLLKGKIIPAGVGIDEERPALCAEFQVMTKRSLKR